MNGAAGCTSISALALSPNRRYLAVAESSASFPLLSVFDLRTLKRRRTFGSPSMAQAAMASQAAAFHSLAALAFSADNRHLAAVSEGAEAVVMEWQWQKEQLTAVGLQRHLRAARSLSYAPNDAAVLLLSGDGGFVLLSVDWDSATIQPAPLTQTDGALPSSRSPLPSLVPAAEAVDGEGAEAVDVASLDLTCHAWLDGSGERCVFGARQGLLLMARHGRVVSQVGVHDGGVSAALSSTAAFHPRQGRPLTRRFRRRSGRRMQRRSRPGVQRQTDGGHWELLHLLLLLLSPAAQCVPRAAAPPRGRHPRGPQSRSRGRGGRH